MHPNPPIRVSAVVLTDDGGRVALVRKHGTRFFIFPGGKPEPGEDGVTTAVREVSEELGVTLDPANVEHLGNYTTDAANEAGTELLSQVYAAQLPADTYVTAKAEIAELLWATPGVLVLPVQTQLAPLSGTVLDSLS